MNKEIKAVEQFFTKLTENIVNKMKNENMNFIEDESGSSDGDYYEGDNVEATDDMFENKNSMKENKCNGSCIRKVGDSLE